MFSDFRGFDDCVIIPWRKDGVSDLLIGRGLLLTSIIIHCDYEKLQDVFLGVTFIGTIGSTRERSGSANAWCREYMLGRWNTNEQDSHTLTFVYNSRHKIAAPAHSLGIQPVLYRRPFSEA